MQRLWNLISTLSQPSKFANDPYGGLLNQWGHYSLGAAIFVLTASGYFMAFGEMPYRIPLAAALILAYASLIELAWQGWRGKDSIEDSLFFSGGVITVAASTHEIAIRYPYSVILFRPEEAFAMITAAIGFSVAYAISRVRRQA